MSSTRRRSLSHVLADVERLSPIGLMNVWAWLSERTPFMPPGETRMTSPHGQNRSVLAGLSRRCSGLIDVPCLRQARQLCVALWLQDNPRGLIGAPCCPSPPLRGDTAD